MKHFNFAAFKADVLASPLYNKGYRELETILGHSRSKINFVLSGHTEKMDVDLFFSFCIHAKLNPAKYMKK